MLYKYGILLVFLAGILLVSDNLNPSVRPVEKPVKEMNWTIIEKGLTITELNAVKKAVVGDSKITIVKINPAYFDFELFSAKQTDSIRKTAEEWSAENNLVAVINAGMYNLHDYLTCTGFMKNFSHFNNKHVRDDYKCMVAFNRKNSNVPEFMIIDMEHDNWNNLKNEYNSFAQGIRMIDCNQKLIRWKPKIPVSSSMVVIATDIEKNVLFVFARSPYTANAMSEMLLSFPIGIYNAMYLEGGPEASLYVQAGDTMIEKVGSYVSRTYPRNDNDHFWPLPNVIGVRRKK